MKRLLSFLLIILSVNLHAQYDTSYIRLAFEYIKTEEFKVALKNYTEAKISKYISTYPGIRKRAKQYKKEQRSRMNFWIINSCLVPDRFYFVPDSSGGKFNGNDSLSYQKFDKSKYNRSPISCDKEIVIEFRFLDSQTVELRHFSGQNIRIPFGEINILRLKITAGNFNVFFRGDMILN